jgi:hypothetical protein
MDLGVVRYAADPVVRVFVAKVSQSITAKDF